MDALVFIAFTTLVGLTIANPASLAKLRTKSLQDWLIDGCGLVMQGILIPILKVTIIYWLYQWLIPDWQSCLHWPGWIAFLVSFVLLDYLYYWNHRLLHSSLLWPLHQVHHTVTEMDVLGTSRNTIWSSFFILYLWVHALLIYLLSDPTAYVLGASLTSALDLWRHSLFTLKAGSWGDRLLTSWLILPQDHAWHHASEPMHCNYGGNLKLWDKLYGTYHNSENRPAILGLSLSLTLPQKLFFPWKTGS